MGFEGLLDGLQAGGNIAMMAVAVYLVRIDRRVLVLEVRAGLHKGKGG